MTDFYRPYRSEWKVVSVNEDTWDSDTELEGVCSVSVTHDGTDSVPLLEAASLTVDAEVASEFNEGWYRIVMTTVQDLIYESYPVATVLLQKSKDTISRNMMSMAIEGSSVLKPLDERKNIGTDYRYAPKGVNGANWVRELIDSVSPAPVYVLGTGFTLNDNVVFSPGVSYLQMIWGVLDAGKWCMQIDGSGVVYILEKPKEPSMLLDGSTLKYVTPSLSRELSYIDVPNRYYAIDRDGVREIAENHDPNSALSYENRGRWIDYVDTSPTKINGETLYRYARRRLEEESTLVHTYSYTREYVPEVLPFSIIRASLPAYGLVGDLRVLSQTINCGKGITVDETAGLEIKGWTA